MRSIEPRCYYCVHAEGACPECVERSAFVATEEAIQFRPKPRRRPIKEDGGR